MMLLSDSVGGADDSRNGFSNLSPVNVTDRSAAMDPPGEIQIMRQHQQAQIVGPDASSESLIANLESSNQAQDSAIQ